MANFGAMDKILRDTGKAKELMSAASDEDLKRLEGIVDKKAVEAALAKGDVKSLEGILRQVLNTGEGKALAEKISGIMGK